MSAGVPQNSFSWLSERGVRQTLGEEAPPVLAFAVLAVSLGALILFGVRRARASPAHAPVVLDVSGERVELDPRPSRVWLVAKRDFFVLIDGSRVKTSLDGVQFDRRPAKPGTFRLGFGADANGPRVEVAVTTPVHAR